MGIFSTTDSRVLTDDQADVIAYCLMPNHYHILTLIKASDFGLSVMKSLSNSYVKSINKEQDRTGTLFQGGFKEKRVPTNDVLLHLTRYIHLNPVRAGLVERPEDWAYSSYRDYLGLRNGTLPKPSIILNQFSSRHEYASFVSERTMNEKVLWDVLLD